MDIHSREETLIACRHDIFSKEERMEYERFYKELQNRRVGMTELEDGYQFQYHGDLETLRLIFGWVSLERKCCPFLTFKIIAGSEDEPAFLQVTGNGEVKSFLRVNVRTT